jgi:hypothetical protein
MRDCAFIDVALWTMLISLLQLASTFKLWTGQSPVARKEANIGAPIIGSAPTTQISLRQEIPM